MKIHTLDQQQFPINCSRECTITLSILFPLKKELLENTSQYDIDNIVKSYTIELQIFSCGIAVIIKSLSLKNHRKLTLQTRAFSQRYEKKIQLTLLLLFISTLIAFFCISNTLLAIVILFIQKCFLFHIIYPHSFHLFSP